MLFFSVPFLIAACGAFGWFLFRSGTSFVGGAIEAGYRNVGLAALVAVGYTAVLTGVSLAGGKDTRKPGSTECFGTWCATVTDLNVYDKEVRATLHLRNSSADHAVAPSLPNVVATDSKGRSF